jgi:hypothetical protein
MFFKHHVLGQKVNSPTAEKNKAQLQVIIDQKLVSYF